MFIFSGFLNFFPKLMSCNPTIFLAVPTFHLSVCFLEHTPTVLQNAGPRTDLCTSGAALNGLDRSLGSREAGDRDMEISLCGLLDTSVTWEEKNI